MESFASKAINAFKAADQQQPKVDARRQARATDRLRAEADALAFDDLIEAVSDFSRPVSLFL